MDRAAHLPVLAIDGGGTRCRLALAEGDARIAVEAGGANVTTDFDDALREILRGLEHLAECAGRSPEALAALPAFVGLAGVTGPGIAGRLRAALPFGMVRIDDDRPAALRGALGRRDGVVAHCGTGSFFAAQTGGTMRLSGGWGPILGDEASAQWTGRAALRLTLEAVDGRGKASDLTRRILSEFGDAAGIVAFAAGARPEALGALGPRVTAAAADGDPVALRIMRAGAGEIARAVRSLGWTPALPLCLTGGIGPHYALYLEPDLRARVMPPEGTPLDGAVALARELAGEAAA